MNLSFPTIVLMLLACASHVKADGISFRPDDAMVACRAILPQCFTRADWAELCTSQPEIRVSFPDACRMAEGH